MELADARVLLTGASRGLGAALARELADRGSRLALVARSEAPLRAVADEVAGVALVADLAEPSGREGLVERAEEALGGPLDVLVNNAGVVEVGPLWGASAASVARQVDVDLLAPLELIRQALPGMLARGRGHLVSVSSLQSTTPTPGCTAYGASKAGLSHLHGILRLELAGTPVRTTLVSPGPVGTELWDELDGSAYLRPFLARLRRLGVVTTVGAEELAGAIAEGVARDRRHVRAPRRAGALLGLAELPRRLVEAALWRVRFDQPGAAAANDR
jgi:short-subunit dehydrogenase